METQKIPAFSMNDLVNLYYENVSALRKGSWVAVPCSLNESAGRKEGCRQAAQLGNIVSKTQLKLDNIVLSPLGRAVLEDVRCNKYFDKELIATLKSKLVATREEQVKAREAEKKRIGMYAKGVPCEAGDYGRPEGECGNSTRYKNHMCHLHQKYAAKRAEKLAKIAAKKAAAAAASSPLSSSKSKSKSSKLAVTSSSVQKKSPEKDTIAAFISKNNMIGFDMSPLNEDEDEEEEIPQTIPILEKTTTPKKKGGRPKGSKTKKVTSPPQKAASPSKINNNNEEQDESSNSDLNVDEMAEKKPRKRRAK